MIGSKKRPGRHSIPRWLYQPCGMTTDERFLLIYLASHNPSLWIFKVENICRDLGWGRNKYFRVVGKLESMGLVRRQTEYVYDKESGKRVSVGSRITVNADDLSTKIETQEDGPKYPKPNSPKQGHIRVSIDKGCAQDFEVIDEGDVA